MCAQGGNLTTPTVEDILTAIRRAASRTPERPRNIIRAVELQTALGWGHVQTRDWIRAQIVLGNAEPCKWPHKDMSGRVRRVEMYRFLDIPE